MVILLLSSFAVSYLNANTKRIRELSSFKSPRFYTDTVFNFDQLRSGTLPDGWMNVSGNYIVKQYMNNKVLAQMAENRGMDFNVTVYKGAILKNVEISVDIMAIDGKEDQGGGLVWRYTDRNNYYVVRFNPLEDNFRLYKVLKGKRIQLVSAGVTVPKGSWFNVKVVMKDTEITCYLNGKKLIAVSDDTFTEAGKSGCWTKADAVSDFDNFRLHGE